MTTWPRRVVITGVGVVNAAVRGASAALGAWLDAPYPVVRRVADAAGGSRLAAEIEAHQLEGLVDAAESRRMSRVCQLTVAAARLALAEARVEAGAALALVVGTEFGDLRSTAEFADGYLSRGPTGLSVLLFPNTVMNTMAAVTAIAVQARACSLTLTAPTVAGELAVARGAAAIASGRLEAVLAGGVDQIDAEVQTAMTALGGGDDARGEGATFVVLEALEAARLRGARVLGEVRSSAWRSVPARPCGVGRSADPRAIGEALDRAGLAASGIGWIYGSASGDGPRDRWEERLLAAGFGSDTPPVARLGPVLGGHAGLGALRVAAAAWTARSGFLPRLGASTSAAPGEMVWLARVPLGPGLVHGIARGGVHVALVVDAGPPEA